MKRKWLVWAPLAFGGFLLFMALGGAVVQQLWNWLVPAVFGWRQVTFWQALGLLALCRILFGGIGGHGSGRHGVRNRIGERMAERMGERTAARWDRMTPEERERFRQGMRGRCGFGPSTSDSHNG
jgi:hypothetical protein